MKKIATRLLAVLLTTAFACQIMLTSSVFAEELTQAQFVVKDITITNNLENSGSETFVIDSVKVFKNMDVPATITVCTYKDNKLYGIKSVPLVTGTGEVTVDNIGFSQNGFVTDFVVKAFVWNNMQAVKPLAVPYIFGTREPAILETLSTTFGTFGTSVTINGSGFSLAGELNKVYFTETATGQKLEAGVIESTATTVKVIAPVLNSGLHNVTVEIEGSVSNALTFEAIAMIEPTGNETDNLLNVSNSLVSTSSDIVDMFANSTLADAQKSNLSQLLTNSTAILLTATASFEGLSPEARNLIDKVLANGEMSQVLDTISGDGSTQMVMLGANNEPDYMTTDMLDNVDRLIKNVRTARNTIRTINTSLKYLAASLALAGTASSIFGGSGSSLIALAADINSFRTSVIMPVLDVLSTVYSVLACSMMSASAGSLEFTYDDDVKIDQYFSKMSGVPEVEPQPNTLKSKLALVNLKVDDVSYYREEIMNTLDIPYIKGSSEKMGKSDFNKLLNNLSYYEIYANEYNACVFDENGAVKSAEGLKQNAGHILSVLNVYKNISSTVASQAEDRFWDLIALRDNLGINNTPINSKWYQIMKYNLEDTIDSANRLNTLLNELIDVFSNPSIIVDEVDATPSYSGFEDESGVLLAGQNYFVRGNMDFNVGIDKSQAIDAMTDSIEESFVTSLVTSFVDLDIQLQDVPVRLTCLSSDSSIIEVSWSDSTGLQIIPKRPGKATLTIYPNISFVKSGRIKQEYLTIIKEFEVVSGDYTSQNYDSNNQLGPRIDSVTDDNGVVTQQSYLGENINIAGKGFSSLKSQFQNIYMAGASNIGVDSLVPHFLQSCKQDDLKFARENITLETPDTLSGDMRVAVGLNQNGESVLTENRSNWLSNPIHIDILKPIINFMPSNLIKGESYPIIGRGFSHTPKWNKIIFDNDEKEYATATRDYFSIVEPSLDTPFATPIEYEKADAENHSILHSLHNRLTFIAPNDVGNSTQNSIKSLETDAMKVVSNGSIIKSFGTDTSVSNTNNIGMRPSIAYDTTLNKRLAMWFDMNDKGGSVLVSSFIDSQGNMSNTSFVADNLGSIEASPEKVALCAKNGKFYAAYVGKGTNNNDEVYLTVNNGSGWSLPKNISLSSTSSIKPAITADDFDHDGDIDVMLFYIEDTGTVSNLNAQILVYNEFSGYSSVFQNTVSQNSNTTPALYSENGEVAIAFNKYVNTASNMYASKLNITGHNDTLSLDINAIFKLSDNTGYQKAENPSLVIAKNPIDNQDRICVVWENTSVYDREDIFMATVDESVKSEVTNLTNSILHSQGAVLSKGADETIALAFIEQGFDDVSAERTQGFHSKLYFTRSFDGGLNFQRPYMCMADYGDNGVRLGHTAIVNQGNGDISLIWQKENEIVLKTTNGNIISPQEHYINTKIPRQNTLSYAYNDNNTYKLTNSSGEAVRNIYSVDADIFDNAELSSRISISPSGRYIAIPSYWARIAEADGAFPIDVCLPHNSEKNYPKHINWTDDENKLYATFIEFGVIAFSPNGIINTDASQWMRTNTFGYSNPKQSSYIYSKTWSDSVPNTYTDYYIAKNYGMESEYFTSLPNQVLAQSPDGNAILYLDNYNGNKNNGLCARLIDGIAIQITDKDVCVATFSSDGSKIAYVAKNDNNKNAVFVLDMEINTTTELYEISGGDINAVRFTPDDSEIILSTSLSTVYIDVTSKVVTNTALFVNDFINIGEKSGGIIVNKCASVTKPSGTLAISVKLSKQPTSDVTVDISCQNGILINKTSLTFTSDNYNIPQELIVASTSDTTLGLSLINFISQSSDYMYNQSKCNLIVGTEESGSFRLGSGFIASGYDANVAYPNIHNWSRQSLYKASNGEDVLWQIAKPVSDSKILADGNGNTVVYGQDLTVYNKAGAKLWECNGSSPVLFDNKVYYIDGGIKYRDISTGAEGSISLVDTDNTAITYYPMDIFFVDDLKNIYATARDYSTTSHYYILKISPNGGFQSIMINEFSNIEQAIPLVTFDGKIVVHNYNYIDIFNIQTLAHEHFDYYYDDVLNISAVDQKNPSSSIFFLTTKDESANTVTVKAMRMYDNSALWFKTFEGTTRINTNSAITDDGMIYLPVNNIMYAINSNSGKILWQYDSGNYIGGSPIIDADGTIYFTAGTDLILLSPNGVMLKRNTYATNGTFESNVVIGNNGQIYFGGGVDLNNAKLPIFCVGKQELNTKAGTVNIVESAVSVSEDDEYVLLKVVDDSIGEKGGFTADIMLVPDTATLYNDYSLDWTHTNSQIVFAEGESEKYIKINISDGYEVSPTRKFKVKLSEITGNKQLNSDFTEVTINDVSLPYDEKFKIGFAKTEIVAKEGTGTTLTINRGANEKGLYPAATVKIVIGSEGSYNYFSKAIDGIDYTMLPAPINGVLTLEFADSEISKDILVSATDNQESSSIRKLDLQIRMNSAMQVDYSYPPQYPSQTKVYITEPTFTVPKPIVKVLNENEIAISNIMYWGRFEVYNPQGEKLFDMNGYQNSTDAEYSIGTLTAGNGYKVRGFFADEYVDTYFNVNGN